jgi:hypothetical protein
MEFGPLDGAMPRGSVANTPTIWNALVKQGRAPIPITYAKEWFPFEKDIE